MSVERRAESGERRAWSRDETAMGRIGERDKSRVQEAEKTVGSKQYAVKTTAED